MSPPGDNDRARWQAVLSVFRHNVGTLKCAFEVEQAQEGVIDMATQLMREVIADWNRTTITYRLPPEILSACFSYLPLGTLLATTRVSRWWRTTSLSCRELWTSVVFDRQPTNLGILRMIVERSGQLPLDLEFHIADDIKDELVDYLETQIHRTRRIAWFTGRVDFLQKPAPMLESLDCETLCPVPESLLGGTPSRLRTLRLNALDLPPRCPALASLTSLSADLSHNRNGTRSLANLFSLCPLLECLELDGLTGADYAHLSVGTPTRLKTLNLSSSGMHACDLMAYVHAWGPSNPSLLQIALHMEGSPSNAAPMFDDIETLSVTQRVGRGSPSIETTRTHGRRFTLVRREPWNATINFDALSSTLAAIIRPHGALLGTLRVLRAPVTVLDALLLPAPAPVLHALRTLTAVVQMWIPEKQPAYSRALYGDPSPVFPAAQLACLSQLCHSALARIEVVSRGLTGVAFIEGHARDVLATLAESLPARSQQEDTEVVLRFPGGLAISEDTLPFVNGYRIVVQEGEKMQG